jgi:predicted O-linked N-acetylglucosamine transferase (SPINDLY family)
MSFEVDEAETVLDRANKLCSQEKWKEAAELYFEALASQPDHEWALNNLGYALARLGERDDAIVALKRCIAVNPNNVMAHANLVMAIGEADHQRFEAIPYRRRLTELCSDAFEYPFALANVLLNAGRISEALFYYRRALEIDPSHCAAISNYLLTLNYADDLSVEQIALEHFRWAQHWSRPQASPQSFAQPLYPGRKLRIGYLSGDFSNHPVGKIIQPIIAAHDPRRMEIHAFSDSATDDHWTNLIRRSAAGFVTTDALNDDQLEQIIRERQIDVLVELTGHTGGRNRLGVLARRVAPIQVSFLGYPNTTGLAAVDYRLTDPFCDPPGRTERLHAEKLIRLERGFLCYAPFQELPDTLPAPYRSHGHPTLGSFNNSTKVSPSALAAWCRILQQVPEARLVVKYGGRFASGWLCERWRGLFASAGVDPRRVTFLPAVPTTEGHYRTIGGVDLALDPFPYQGTHTTLETLAMGVPVVTLAGETYSRRASSALLLRLGFDELVTASPDEYVARAVALLKRPERLEEFRGVIRERFLKSEICDVSGYVAELEDVYSQLWREWSLARLKALPEPGAPDGPPQAFPRIVLCSGMPRSGSTWSYNVCRLLLTEVMGADLLEAGYREGNVAEQYLADIGRTSKMHLLKLHYPGPAAADLISRGRAKNIYTVRHPLDAVASFGDALGEPIASAAQHIKDSLDSADQWHRQGNALFIDFDALASEPRNQIRRIAEYLEIEADAALVERIHEQTSLEAVQAFSEQLATSPDAVLARAPKAAYDRVTLYHIGHVSRQGQRDWRTDLTPDEQQTALTILGTWLDRWPQTGSPFTNSAAETTSPATECSS